jgi:hypothetical protein
MHTAAEDIYFPDEFFIAVENLRMLLQLIATKALFG